jgi:general secretion pathway protein N
MSLFLSSLPFHRLPNNRRWWILLGVGLFVFFLLRHIPATWGAYALTRGTNIALSGVTGSLWEGRASLASARLAYGEHSLGQLSWDLSPLSLLTLTPCAYLTTTMEGQTFEGDVCASSNGNLTISDADLTLPATLMQPRIPIPVGGQFSLHVDDLEVRGNVLTKLKGKLTWTEALINNGGSWLGIGSFGAELVDNGSNGVKANIFHLTGPAELDLQLELKAPAGGSVQGKLLVSKSFLESANAMQLMGVIAQEQETDAEGRTQYQVDMNF